MPQQAEYIADYIAVPVATILPSSTMGVALYLQSESNGSMKLYRGGDYPFEQEDLQNLVERGISTLYVATAEREHYQQYLRENIASVVEDESLPVGQRFTTLNEVVRDVLKNSFQKGNVGETVEHSRELANYTVDLVSSEGAAAADFLRVLHHDYHTFTHSANVSYYCVMLSTALGIDDKDVLNEIATGALLHDLGKLDIPEEILNKPGKLDDAEFDVIKRHPTTGFVKMSQRDDVTFEQMMMTYQHHERLDGSGYPVGVVGDEIHEWAQICAVVDVFEALTSDRPYRAGMPISKALEIIDRDSGTGFNESFVECWKTLISSSVRSS